MATTLAQGLVKAGWAEAEPNRAAATLIPWNDDDKQQHVTCQAPSVWTLTTIIITKTSFHFTIYLSQIQSTNLKRSDAYQTNGLILNTAFLVQIRITNFLQYVLVRVVWIFTLKEHKTTTFLNVRLINNKKWPIPSRQRNFLFHKLHIHLQHPPHPRSYSALSSCSSSSTTEAPKYRFLLFVNVWAG